MPPATAASNRSSSCEEAEAPGPGVVSEESLAEPWEGRNFLVLTAYQVMLRVGWIFKTESIVMPAVLDSLGGAGWLRGCLPLLNRFGQGIPPLLMMRRMKVAPLKKYLLAQTTLIMSAAFLALAVIWFLAQGDSWWWMPLAFLVLYAVFFVSTGIHQLCFSTLQGKLIQTTHRGRLLLASNVAGAFCAIVSAALLMPVWLERPEGFAWIFGFSGLCFAGAAVLSLVLAEPADDFRQASAGVAHLFASAWNTVCVDRHFRRLAAVAALFGTSIMLFPHYQALGREQLGIRLGSLVWWVVIQNAGTALFSIFVGPLADRRGNRAVLRLLLLSICAAPLLALALAAAGASSWFGLVFLLVGMTPVAIRTFHNFALELAPRAEHPRYLSTLNVCMSAPLLLSPLVGKLVDGYGFSVVFLAVTGLVLGSWGLTFGLHEPRAEVPDQPSAETDE